MQRDFAGAEQRDIPVVTVIRPLRKDKQMNGTAIVLENDGKPSQRWSLTIHDNGNYTIKTNPLFGAGLRPRRNALPQVSNSVKTACVVE